MWAAISTLTLTACQSVFADRKIPLEPNQQAGDTKSDMTRSSEARYEDSYQWLEEKGKFN